MFQIPRKQTWTSPPQGLVKASEIIGDGLLVSTAGGSLTEGVKNKALIVPSTLAYNTDRTLGRCLTNSSQSIHAIDIGQGIRTTNWTVIFIGTLIKDSASGYNAIARIINGGFTVQFDSLYGAVEDLSIVLPGIANYSSGVVTPYGAPCVYIFTATNGINYDLIIRRLDTQQVIVDTGNTLGTPGTSSGNSTFFSEPTAGFGTGNGSKISTMAILPRRLSVAEALTIALNPYLLFKQPDSHIFVPVTSGAGPANITGTSTIVLEDLTTNFQAASGHIGTSASSLQDIVVSIGSVIGHTSTVIITLDDVIVTCSGELTSAGSVSGTLSATLDGVVVTSAGVIGHSGVLDSVLADVFVSFSGTVAETPEDITGTGVIILDGIDVTIAGSSGTLTLTEDDINAIMNAIIANPKTLTVPKFLGLK